MKLNRRVCAAFAAALFYAVVVFANLPPVLGAKQPTLGRIIVLMVFDGLRPDAVNESDAPNLSALMREGVALRHHHAIFPTLTMVNAAALATGGLPAATGIMGDSMYLALDLKQANSIPVLSGLLERPIDLENSRYLAALNGPGAFDGRLLGIEGVAQEVERAGGYAAIIGKQGPTFLFDDRMGEAASHAPAGEYLFLSDDMAVPAGIASELPSQPAIKRDDPGSVIARDAWFTDVALKQALPVAKAASSEGRPALVVLWQHNVDLAQHVAGLGTKPALEALRQTDANLGRIRAAIGALGIVERTDVLVVSDHGFATIRMRVSLRDLLVEAGIKKSNDSMEIIVAPNGGNDLVYLSPTEFGSEEARRAMLVRIVNFAEAQEWCGPIFSLKPATGAKLKREEYLGWIPGTFAQESVGLYNAERSPDLVISFRELAEVDNQGLTGPGNPAFALEGHGRQTVANRSYELVRPIAGLVYSDTDSEHFTTGMGTHGAAGARELHNFAAAVGPDFRRHFVDTEPTGNTDIAATIRHILHEAEPAGAMGRAITEALIEGGGALTAARQSTMTAYLALQGVEVVTTLRSTRFDGHDYLDDASVRRKPIGNTR
jgi:type I phosphodiesterase/nucleotide pyrophosphatase